MINKFSSFIKRLFESKKTPPSLKPFESIEKELRHARPTARPAFKQDLKAMLRARHQALAEERLEQEAASTWNWNWFSIHRTAAVTLVFSLVFVVGGGSYVVSADSPTPEHHTIEGISAEWQPDVMPITVTFDQPMMKGSVEDSFSIQPAVDGQFIWEGSRKVHFLPNEPLTANTQYKVVIAEEARSILQKKFTEPYTRDFDVLELATAAQDLGEESPFYDLNALRKNDQDLSAKERRALREEVQGVKAEIEILIKEGVIEKKPTVKEYIDENQEEVDSQFQAELAEKLTEVEEAEYDSIEEYNAYVEDLKQEIREEIHEVIKDQMIAEHEAEREEIKAYLEERTEEQKNDPPPTVGDNEPKDHPEGIHEEPEQPKPDDVNGTFEPGGDFEPGGNFEPGGTFESKDKTTELSSINVKEYVRNNFTPQEIEQMLDNHSREELEQKIRRLMEQNLDPKVELFPTQPPTEESTTEEPPPPNESQEPTLAEEPPPPDATDSDGNTDKTQSA
jgi:hypothetical protein